MPFLPLLPFIGYLGIAFIGIFEVAGLPLAENSGIVNNAGFMGVNHGNAFELSSGWLHFLSWRFF